MELFSAPKVEQQPLPDARDPRELDPVTAANRRRALRAARDARGVDSLIVPTASTSPSQTSTGMRVAPPT